MADETPQLDDARLKAIRSTIMQALVVGDSDYVENRARIALDELLAEVDRLRAREAAMSDVLATLLDKVPLYVAKRETVEDITAMSHALDAARDLLAQE